MGRSRRHRPNVELRRKQAKDDARAHEAKLAQEAAAFRVAWRKKRRRKAWSYVFFALAPIVAVTHILEHGGAFQLFSPGLEDLLIGYPTALLLVIVGAIWLGTDQRPARSRKGVTTVRETPTLPAGAHSNRRAKGSR